MTVMLCPCWARTSAAITLFIISMTVLAMVARPLIGIRLVLVIAMGVGFLGFLYIPWLSEFFALRIDDDAKTSIAVILGALGAGAFVLINRMTSRRLAATETSVPRVEATDHQEARR